MGFSPSELEAIPSDDQQGIAMATGIPKRKQQILSIYKESESTKQTRSKSQSQQILSAAANSSGSEPEMEPLISLEGETEDRGKQGIKTEGRQDLTDILTNISMQLRQIPIMANQLQELTPIKADINKIFSVIDVFIKKQDETDKKINELERSTEEIADKLKAIEPENDAWSAERKSLLGKIDSLENHSRRNNIKIVGLKEGIEGKDPIDYFQKWIPKTLELGEENQIFEIDRAHRALKPKPQEDKQPRSILIRFLRYQDRENTLKAAIQRAKEVGPLMIEGKRVFFLS